METKITYFVHGTTFDNSDKLCSGWKDVELNELGIEQALNLGKVSSERGDKFDIVFTSDLKRSMKSAELAFPNIKKVADKRLRECNYGDYDGLNKSFVVYENFIYNQFPNGESLLDVELRISDFINYIKEDFKGKSIAIVAHRAPQLALNVLLNKETWETVIKNDWRKTGAWQPGWDYILRW